MENKGKLILSRFTFYIDIDTKVRKFPQMDGKEAVQSPQSREESAKNRQDEVGEGEQNYSKEERSAGKMDRNESGVFQLEFPSHLQGQGIT